MRRSLEPQRKPGASAPPAAPAPVAQLVAPAGGAAHPAFRITVEPMLPAEQPANPYDGADL